MNQQNNPANYENILFRSKKKQLYIFLWYQYTHITDICIQKSSIFNFKWKPLCNFFFNFMKLATYHLPATQ